MHGRQKQEEKWVEPEWHYGIESMRWIRKNNTRSAYTIMERNKIWVNIVGFQVYKTHKRRNDYVKFIDVHEIILAVCASYSSRVRLTMNINAFVYKFNTLKFKFTCLALFLFLFFSLVLIYCAIIIWIVIWYVHNVMGSHHFDINNWKRLP